MLEFEIMNLSPNYDINLLLNKKEIGNLLIKKINSKTTMEIIGYENFSIEEQNKLKEKYDKIEKILNQNKKTIKIDALAILPEYRNKGYAKKLLNEGISFIEKELKISFIFLEVLPFDLENESLSKEELIKFYRKMGFHILSDNKRKLLMFKDENYHLIENKINKQKKEININKEFEELLLMKNLDSLDDYDNNENYDFF